MKIFTLVLCFFSNICFTKQFQKNLETILWTAEHAHTLIENEAEIISRLQKDIKDIFWTYLLSLNYLQRFQQKGEQGYLRQAMKLSEQVIQLNPNSELGYLALAYIALELGDLTQASLIVGEISYHHEMTPLSWRYDDIQARIAFQQGDTKKLLQYLKKVLQHKDVEKLVVFGFMEQIVTKTKDQFIDDIEQVIRLYKWESSEYYRLKSQIYQLKHRNKKAFNLLVKAYQLDPKNLRTCLQLTALQNQLYGASEKYIDVLAPAISPNARLEDQIFAHAYLAGLYTLKNEDKQSLLHCEKSLKVNLLQGVVLNKLEKIYQQVHYQKGFLLCLKHVNTLDPSNPELVVALGKYYLHKKSYRLAVKEFAKAVILVPEELEFLNYMGMALSYQEKWDPALKVFRKVINRDPLNAQAYYQISLIFSYQKIYKFSLKFLKKAIKIDKIFLEKAKNDKKLRKNFNRHEEFQAIIRR